MRTDTYSGVRVQNGPGRRRVNVSLPSRSSLAAPARSCISVPGASCNAGGQGQEMACFTARATPAAGQAIGRRLGAPLARLPHPSPQKQRLVVWTSPLPWPTTHRPPTCDMAENNSKPSALQPHPNPPAHAHPMAALPAGCQRRAQRDLSWPTLHAGSLCDTGPATLAPPASHKACPLSGIRQEGKDERA